MITIQPPPTGGDVDVVGRQLDEAFAQMKAAVLDEQPVTIVVADADLLGQGDPCDAAVATALLGMVRTLAMEGAKPGWRVNMISHRSETGDDPRIEQARAAFAAVDGLSGQLIRIGTEHVGKVMP